MTLLLNLNDAVTSSIPVALSTTQPQLSVFRFQGPGVFPIHSLVTVCAWPTTTVDAAVIQASIIAGHADTTLRTVCMSCPSYYWSPNKAALIAIFKAAGWWIL